MVRKFLHFNLFGFDRICTWPKKSHHRIATFITQSNVFFVQAFWEYDGCFEHSLLLSFLSFNSIFIMNSLWASLHVRSSFVNCELIPSNVKLSIICLFERLLYQIEFNWHWLFFYFKATLFTSRRLCFSSFRNDLDLSNRCMYDSNHILYILNRREWSIDSKCF